MKKLFLTLALLSLTSVAFAGCATQNREEEAPATEETVEVVAPEGTATEETVTEESTGAGTEVEVKTEEPAAGVEAEVVTQ